MNVPVLKNKGKHYKHVISVQNKSFLNKSNAVYQYNFVILGTVLSLCIYSSHTHPSPCSATSINLVFEFPTRLLISEYVETRI